MADDKTTTPKISFNGFLKILQASQDPVSYLRIHPDLMNKVDLTTLDGKPLPTEIT